MILHHVGCAVASIEEGLRTYTEHLQFERRSEIVDITSQQVRVCFVETAPGVFVELVEGVSSDSPVSQYLKRKQYYYHVAYSVPDVCESVRDLESKGFHMLSVFESEAFNGTDCAFLLTQEFALIELCTQGAFTLL